MWLFMVPARVASVVLLCASLFWPIGGGTTLVVCTAASGLVATMMVFGVRPTKTSVDKFSIVLRVKRDYAYAILSFPVTGQILASSLTWLCTACWVLVPLELWKGSGWLAALAVLPQFVFARTIILLNPYAHANSPDPRLREEVGTVIELKEMQAAEVRDRD